MPTEHPVYGENLTEGATTPILMVRRGTLKYVCSAVDPEQLFDLAEDPLEQTNLAADAARAAQRAELAALARTRWDAEALHEAIFASQRRRLVLHSLTPGRHAPGWDYRPPDPLESACLRADRICSQWAYQSMLDFQVPEE